MLGQLQEGTEDALRMNQGWSKDVPGIPKECFRDEGGHRHEAETALYQCKAVGLLSGPHVSGRMSFGTTKTKVDLSCPGPIALLIGMKRLRLLYINTRRVLFFAIC